MKKKVVNKTEVAEPVTPKWQTYFRTDDPESPMVSFEFEGLKELVSYEVKVRSRNSEGWSEYNQPFVFTTSHGQQNSISLVFLLQFYFILLLKSYPKYKIDRDRNI